MDVETQIHPSIHPSMLTRASSVCDGTRKPYDDDVGIVFFFSIVVVVVDRGGASTNAAKTTSIIFSRTAASTRAQGW